MNVRSDFVSTSTAGTPVRTEPARGSSTSSQQIQRHDHVLRYESLRDEDPCYAFPCDERGQVDIDQLTERERVDYFYARVVAGNALARPLIVALH